MSSLEIATGRGVRAGELLDLNVEDSLTLTETQIRAVLPYPKWRATWLLLEADVYQMLLRSNSPTSEPFRKWVTEEVLPTIRKTGINKGDLEVSSDLRAPNQSMTMSSLEIAELTGKQHKNVLVDIRTMLDELGDHSAGFSAQYKDSTGRTLPCFNLDRHHTECLLTGYSAKMRMAVIKRWHELEDLQICRSSNEVAPGAIIESLSGLQTEVKILKEMIRSIIAGPGVVREVVVKSPYEGTTKGTVSYHADAALIREIGDTMH
ncbi:Rha family transcriptional regulator [Pseudomonas syringae]|uniref:Rha family transcriptional regulator n=1 Tax=Pseudomonas syringae TaxID=317 RepID=UPI001F071E2A|nr:Rha family transcriptional regulator [Pseudomonas syringae]